MLRTLFTVAVASLLLCSCAGTNGDQVSASYRSVNPNSIAGTGTSRRAATIVRATPATLQDLVQERVHSGYRVLGRSTFTSDSSAPLRDAAIAQGMKVNASVLIYSVQPAQHGGGAQHTVVFMRFATTGWNH